MKCLSLLLFLISILVSCERTEDIIKPDTVKVKAINHLNKCAVSIGGEVDSNLYLVINSQEELQNHVLFQGTNNGAGCAALEQELAIDFSKYSLLIGKVRLSAIQGRLLDQSVEINTKGEYQYNIRVMNGGYTAIGQFRFGVIIPKLPKEAQVDFNVTIDEYDD